MNMKELRAAALAESWEMRKSMRDYRPSGRGCETPPPPPTYELRLTCPYCDGAVEHCADGAASPWKTAVVCECTRCGTRLLLSAQVAAAGYIKAHFKKATE